MTGTKSEKWRGLNHLQRWLVSLGLLALIPSLALLPIAMFGIIPADLFTIGGLSGLKVIGSCAVLGCLAAAAGYWDS